MNISEIRKLIRLIQSSDVTEIEVTEGDNTVRVSRGGAAATPMMVTQAPVAAAVPTMGAVAVQVEESGEDEHVVSSPMVGTFYRSSSPDSDAFAPEGTRVKKGDTLCIIEAMKLMNEIEAEYDGVVESVLLENASPVEYGQAMFIITPI